MATWSELDEELRHWRAAGEVPTFWWRDDDARAPTPALERLIALAERFGTPLHLAIIPEAIDPALAGRMAASPLTYALQHGFAHRNHEPTGSRASEVGEARDLALQEADLREGWRRMQAAGLPQLLPVFVPPWNRIAGKTLPLLAELGYAAVSIFDRGPVPAPHLPQINGHIDPIRWKGGAQFAGVERTLEQCVRHLAERREGVAERDEPTGFVTHHLQTDEETWDFSEELMARLTRDGAIEWVALSTVLEAV